MDGVGVFDYGELPEPSGGNCGRGAAYVGPAGTGIGDADIRDLSQAACARGGQGKPLGGDAAARGGRAAYDGQLAHLGEGDAGQPALPHATGTFALGADE